MFLIIVIMFLYLSFPCRSGSRTVVPSGRSARRPRMYSAHRAHCCPRTACPRLGQTSQILPWAMDSVALECLAAIAGASIRWRQVSVGEQWRRHMQNVVKLTESYLFVYVSLSLSLFLYPCVLLTMTWLTWLIQQALASWINRHRFRPRWIAASILALTWAPPSVPAAISIMAWMHWVGVASGEDSSPLRLLPFTQHSSSTAIILPPCLLKTRSHAGRNFPFD